MNIHIQSVQFSADSKLTSFIEKKMSKLQHFYDKIINVEVFLSLDNKGSQVKDKVTKVKVNVPGNQLIVTESSKVFEEGIDLAIDNLVRQLLRYKEKSREA